MTHKLIKTDKYLLAVDNSEINTGDYYYSMLDSNIYKNYGTWETIKAEVENYDLKKIAAHLPLNGAPILEGVDLLPPYHQEDGVDELAKDFANNSATCNYEEGINVGKYQGYLEGYNKAREKYKYTEEDVIRLIEKSRIAGLSAEYLILASQYPTEFECEVKQRFEADKSKRENALNGVYYEPKTATINERKVWVGKYK